MNKQEFLAELRKGLHGLPQNDIEERLTFYNEMIDDRMEEGLTEDAAVSEIGTVNEVISQIVTETPLSKIVKEKVRPKRTLRVWEIVLLALGSPIWLSPDCCICRDLCRLCYRMVCDRCFMGIRIGVSCKLNRQHFIGCNFCISS